VADEAVVRVRNPNSDVSRGAAKIRPVLEGIGLSVEGKRAADLGASTGGFTQVLLELGAECVETFDVGYGLLHESLRTDPRVRVHDRTNVRNLTGGEIDPVQLVVIDLSFIGLARVLPAAGRIATADADFLALVKPQFEAGRENVGKGGVVRDPRVLRGVLEKHLVDLKEAGFVCLGAAPAGVPGKKGNREFFSRFRKRESFGEIPGPIDLDDAFDSILQSFDL